MNKMLTELCSYLNNWFTKGQDRLFGDIIIKDGDITNKAFIDKIQYNQYFRIVGSVFNDGVYQFNDELILNDETFNGAIWLMAIPQIILNLAQDIEKWKAQYDTIDSPNLSPYNSESFGGYSYSKSSGGTSSNGASTTSWQGVFASKLSNWRIKK